MRVQCVHVLPSAGAGRSTSPLPRRPDAVKEGDDLVQHPGVPCAECVATGAERQPEIVVRTEGAHTAARRRVHQVLDVSLAELMGPRTGAVARANRRGSQ